MAHSSEGTPPTEQRTLAPYGYCRFCGTPRPKGGRFCGGERCIHLDGAAAPPDSAGPHGPAEMQGPAALRAAPRAGVRPTVRLAGAPRERRRTLLRDTSLVLLVSGLALIVGIAASGVLRPRGGVLGVTATPAPAAAPRVVPATHAPTQTPVSVTSPSPTSSASPTPAPRWK